MNAVIDHRRHFRVGDRVAWRANKRDHTGVVSTFRMISTPDGELQQLAITGDDGTPYQLRSDAVKLVARREDAAARVSPAPEGPATLAQLFERDPANVDKIAARALKGQRGASLVSIAQLRELAAGYILQRELLRTIALNDRSAPYDPGERRAIDGAVPPDGNTWLTPRQLVEQVKGEVKP